MNNDVNTAPADFLASIKGKAMNANELNRLQQFISDGQVSLMVNLKDTSSFTPSGNMPEDANDVIRVVYLDTETTGLDPTDEIAQLSMIKVLVNKRDGGIIKIDGCYNGFQEPSFKPSQEVWASMRKLSGITPEMLEGQSINQFEVSSILFDADLIVAHKADFDRPMMENNLTEITSLIKSKAWACSMSEIPWSDFGFSNIKLDYLLFRAGYTYEAHRADVDTLALMQLMDSKLDLNGQTVRPMKLLYDKAMTATVKIWATGAPFDAKDKLKSRGYTWHDGSAAGDHKAWAITLPEEEMNLELDYLNREIYGRAVKLPIDKKSSVERHSDPLSPRPRKSAVRSFMP